MHGLRAKLYEGTVGGRPKETARESEIQRERERGEGGGGGGGGEGDRQTEGWKGQPYPFNEVAVPFHGGLVPQPKHIDPHVLVLKHIV